MNIIEMSLQASAMIAVIIIVRALGVNRLPKWGFQVLWGVVLARLLLPMRVEFHLSAYNAVQQFGRTLPTAAPLIATPVRVPLAAVATSDPAYAAVSTVAPAFHISPWVIVWLIGAALLLTYFVIAHLRGRRVYAKARPLSVARAGAFRWSRRVFVKTSRSVDTPLTYGVARPVILIPEALLNRPEFDRALAHELIHIRHWDALKKWLLTLALCVHWFNPLVWVRNVLANRDIELYCDETLLRWMDGNERVQYASMLIDLEEARFMLAPLVSHFGRTAIEERIGAIMKYRKASALGIVLALALVAFTAAALATSAVTPAVETSESPSSPQKRAEASEGAQSEADIFAHYAPFGLVYESDEDQFYCLYYKEEKVRYFEDAVHLPNGESPTYCSMSMDDSGSVDVRAVRDLSKRRINPDGSFDPWAELVGLEPFSQAEFDARTAIYATQRAAKEAEGGAASSVQAEWWTADAYETWLNQQRQELPEMIGSRGWNHRDGWFTWTREKVDGVLAMYEKTLENIRKGSLYSKSVGGDENVAIASGEPKANGVASEEGAQFAGITVPTGSAVAYSDLHGEQAPNTASSQSEEAPASAAADALDGTGDDWTVAPENYTVDEIPVRALNAEDASKTLYQYRVTPVRLDLAALTDAYFGKDAGKLPDVPSGDGDATLRSADYNYALYRDTQRGTIQLRKPGAIPLEYQHSDASSTEGFEEPATGLPTPSPEAGRYSAQEAAGMVLEFLKDAYSMDTKWLTCAVLSEESAAKEKARVYQLCFTYMLDGRRLMGDTDAVGDCIITAYVTDEGIMDLTGNLFEIERVGPVPSGEPMPEKQVLSVATQGNHPPYGRGEICYYLSGLSRGGAATSAVWSLPILDLEKGECFGYELRDGLTGENLRGF